MSDRGFDADDYAINIVSTNSDTTAPQLVDIQITETNYEGSVTDLGFRIDVFEENSGFAHYNVYYNLLDDQGAEVDRFSITGWTI